MKTKKRRLNKSFFIGSLVGFALGALCITQTLRSDMMQEIEIAHQVRPNETFWQICQNYYDENHLKNEIYFLEFVYEVEQKNRWLKDVNYKLQPNDIIKISYKKQKPHALD
ncbi:MAG: hypothetical protein IKN43_11885 [Selenomonadaceae bacterium]|nr:hypothetical protein [Selenomonadaceae bacterium]